MKCVVFVMNFALLCLLLIMFVRYGIPDFRNDTLDSIMVLLTALTPIVSLIYLGMYSGSPGKETWKQSWIFLYFKRKALEERAKIEKLQQGGQPPPQKPGGGL